MKEYLRLDLKPEYAAKDEERGTNLAVIRNPPDPRGGSSITVQAFEDSACLKRSIRGGPKGREMVAIFYGLSIAGGQVVLSELNGSSASDEDMDGIEAIMLNKQLQTVD